MSEVQRYELAWMESGQQYMADDAGGEWVRYTDHARRVGELTSAVSGAMLQADANLARATAAEAALVRAGEDARRLDLIASEYLHLVPFDMPTGGGDADVGWEVRQSQGGSIGDAVLHRHYSDDPRAAIDAALDAARVGG